MDTIEGTIIQLGKVDVKICDACGIIYVSENTRSPILWIQPSVNTWLGIAYTSSKKGHIINIPYININMYMYQYDTRQESNNIVNNCASVYFVAAWHMSSAEQLSVTATVTRSHDMHGHATVGAATRTRPIRGEVWYSSCKALQSRDFW